MSSVTFRHVSKIYPGGVRVIDDLDLAIPQGELLVLVGPSGCGKSTALRMLAGLEEISGGEILIGDRVINDVPVQRRNVAMVFQNYALYPHMTVRANMEFPLRMQKMSRAEIDERVERAASMLDLTALLERKPRALSGGQRQRVAMGRAIVRDASVFLMDEPLSNLDAKLRGQIRGQIAALQRKLGVTTIYVTHDQVEAMTLGHRVAILRGGLLQQVGAPRELYENPANVFVAGFIGNPGMNVFHGTVEPDDAGDLWVVLGEGRLPIGPAARARHPRTSAWAGRDLLVGIRPECLSLGGDSSPALAVRVVAVESLGHETALYADAGIDVVATDALGASASAAPSATGRLVAMLPGHHEMASGDSLKLAVDVDGLHFFATDGTAID
jgi:multiple sugar transport system ATP-binding protein